MGICTMMLHEKKLVSIPPRRERTQGKEQLNATMRNINGYDAPNAFDGIALIEINELQDREYPRGHHRVELVE